MVREYRQMSTSLLVEHDSGAQTTILQPTDLTNTSKHLNITYMTDD